MGKSSDVFLRMSEEHYMSVPNEIRERFLASKRVDEEKGDWKENMNDTIYAHYYYEIKVAKSRLAERQFYLRENRRKLK